MTSRGGIRTEKFPNRFSTPIGDIVKEGKRFPRLDVFDVGG